MVMKNEDIRQLIERFYDGESTEEEEKIIRAYFSGGKCPEGFEAEHEYILYCLENTVIMSPSEGFTRKILESAGNKGHEIAARRVPGRFIYFSSTIAASVILFLSLYLLAGNNRSYPDTYNDPEIAYAETVKILNEVAAKLNKGTKSLDQLGKLNEVSRKSLIMVNESTSIIDESFSKINAIDRFKTLNYNRIRKNNK